MRAVGVADARLDDHDPVLGEACVGAAEGHPGGPGAVGGAAAGIGAGAAVQWPVEASAEAALVLHPDGEGRAAAALAHTQSLECRASNKHWRGKHCTATALINHTRGLFYFYIKGTGNPTTPNLLWISTSVFPPC